MSGKGNTYSLMDMPTRTVIMEISVSILWKAENRFTLKIQLYSSKTYTQSTLLCPAKIHAQAHCFCIHSQKLKRTYILSPGEWMMKMWCTYTVEYYLVDKKKISYGICRTIIRKLLFVLDGNTENIVR